MNEWELQHELSKKYRKEKFLLKGNRFDLILWELMFPSWEINYKRKKWNESSIDFIFYSEASNEFLCVELKNEIRGRKNLLLAFYQTTQRAILFQEQYNVFKIQKARNECFENAHLARGGEDIKLKHISFGKKPTCRRVLMANYFPKNHIEQINYWNAISLENLKQESYMYAKSSREMERFYDLTTKQFSWLSTPLETLYIQL